jgi:hypothetical protein
MVEENVNPYVVFLPTENKSKILSSIFGSKAAVAILRFSLAKGTANKIYQKDMVKNLTYSNKTIIETTKLLTRLEVLRESMEKTERAGRIVWVKAYQLSDIGKWFALLLAEEKDLPLEEKREILENIFRRYVKWMKRFSLSVHVDEKTLRRIFEEEMK